MKKQFVFKLTCFLGMMVGIAWLSARHVPNHFLLPLTLGLCVASLVLWIILVRAVIAGKNISIKPSKDNTAPHSYEKTLQNVHPSILQPVKATNTTSHTQAPLQDTHHTVDALPFGFVSFKLAPSHTSNPTYPLQHAKICTINETLISLLARAGTTAQEGQPFASLFVSSLTEDNNRNTSTHKEVARYILPQTNTSQEQSTYLSLHLGGRKNMPVNIYFHHATQNLSEQNICEPSLYFAYIVQAAYHKAWQEALLRNQTLQEIGKFSGGLAHNFNNYLMTIILNTDELLNRHPIGDPAYPELKQIEQSAHLASTLATQLLIATRTQILQKKAVHIQDIFNELKGVLELSLNEKIKLEINSKRTIPLIMADKGQLSDILLNLCCNARDAMPDGGTISITTQHAHLEDLHKDNIEPQERDISNTGYVIITCKDTGTGMDADTQKSIFDPFFTTKEPGKGTGYGLFTVRSTIRQSEGHLRLNSTPGKGTEFRLYWPIADSKAISAATKLTPPLSAHPIDMAGQGKILFVEDEENMRKVAARILRGRGYNVIEAANGQEALDVLQDPMVEFDLLISDVTMPIINGPDMLKKAGARLNNTQVLFMSGHAKEDFSDFLSSHPHVHFIAKPINTTTLCETVKSLIGQPTGKPTGTLLSKTK